MFGVTKDAGPASCAVVASQWAGGAVREGEVLFSVFFLSSASGHWLTSAHVNVSQNVSRRELLSLMQLVKGPLTGPEFFYGDVEDCGLNIA